MHFFFPSWSERCYDSLKRICRPHLIQNPSARFRTEGNSSQWFEINFETIRLFLEWIFNIFLASDTLRAWMQPEILFLFVYLFIFNHVSVLMLSCGRREEF